MSLNLIEQGLSLQAASAVRLHKFHIKHMDMKGVVHEYDGMFRDSISAIRDCAETFGQGRIKVEAIKGKSRA
jgi:hypothetical protein